MYSLTEAQKKNPSAVTLRKADIQDANSFKEAIKRVLEESFTCTDDIIIDINFKRWNKHKFDFSRIKDRQLKEEVKQVMASLSL